ncbi:unnamed protein product [Sphenostylis stenocarpa]|uniref:Uncharacterized protein n=1 Tax=Sphenostylis stenocarpa TaxID=92480 RepID=A0AA86T6H2_9FABA|nr:unnamed protein product [Sphenostylis stenocarpa]
MRTQTTISRGELGGLCFFGDPCTIANSLTVRKAWEKPVYMGDRELGKARVTVTSDYEAWRRRREMARPSTTPAPIANNEELQAQVNALTQRDHEIERLKDQCADANEQAIRASKTARTSSDNQLQEITARLAHLEAESAQQAQTIKELSEQLLQPRLDLRQERENNRKLNRGLYELRIKDKSGLAQYDQVLQEKDRAVARIDELEALVIHQETKIKEAQKYNEEMS